MAIEIREIIIKTHISGADTARQQPAKDRDLKLLKRQLLDECRRMIMAQNEKNKR